MFPCPLCAANGKYKTTNFRRYIEHLRSCHPGSPITCNVNSCTRVYHTTKSYVKHLKNKHSAFHSKFWLPHERLSSASEAQQDMNSDADDETSTAEEFMSEDDTSENGANDDMMIPNPIEENCDVDYEDLVRLFLLELREEN